jgi:RNA polymerase sigma-32 factor
MRWSVASRPAELAAEGRAHLDRCLDLVGRLPKSRGSWAGGWDAPIIEALRTASPEARAAFLAARQTWWTLARHRSTDIVQREAWRQLQAAGTDRHRVEDLVSYGWLGAYRAAQRWDPGFGTSWRTWCGMGIRQSISAGIRQGRREHVHLSGRDGEALFRLKRELAALEREGLPPDLQVAAELADVHPHAAEQLLTVGRVLHLDATPVGREDGDAHDLVPALDEDLDEKLDQAAELERLREAIKLLPKPEQRVLRSAMEGLTLREIGERWTPTPLSRERIRQIEAQAIRRLREHFDVPEADGTRWKNTTTATERVRQLLERADDPLTARQIADRLGLQTAQAATALQFVGQRVGQRGRSLVWARLDP